MRSFFHHLSGMLLLPVLCLLTACGGPVAESDQLEISLAETTVSSDAGSVFVRVTSSGPWTLDFVEPDVNWARLEMTSGEGSRNSIILSYSANRGSESRSVTVRATAADGKKTSQAVLTQRSYVAPTPSGISGGKAATASFKWLELPETDATELLGPGFHLGGLSALRGVSGKPGPLRCLGVRSAFARCQPAERIRRLLGRQQRLL